MILSSNNIFVRYKYMYVFLSRYFCMQIPDFVMEINGSSSFILC